MSKLNEQRVHDAVNAVMAGDLAPVENPDRLAVQAMENAHDVLRRISGSPMACASLADLMTACYQLGMSRALASVAAGLEEQP